MDNGRFDALARSFATGTPRRTALRMAAGVVAGLFGGRALRVGAQELPTVEGGVAGNGGELISDDGAGLAIADASGGNRNSAIFCSGCGPCRTCDAGGGCVADPDQEGRNCDPGDSCQKDGTCRDGRCEGRKKNNGDRCGNNQVCCDGQCCAADRECRGGRCEEVGVAAVACKGEGESCQTAADCCGDLPCNPYTDTCGFPG